MDLVRQMEKAVGHTVRMIDGDDKVWEGFVSGFTTDLDNEEDDAPGYFSMDLKVKEGGKNIYYEMAEDEIKSIEVLD